MADYRNSSGIVVEDGRVRRDGRDRGHDAGSTRGSSARPSARSSPAASGSTPSAASTAQQGRDELDELVSRAGPIRLIASDRSTRDHRAASPSRPSTREETPHDRSRIRHRRPRRRRLGEGAPRRPERPLRRGRRRHDRLRAEPPAGRRRLELDQPARRRHPPRHRQPRGVQRSSSSESGIGPDTTIVLYGDNNNWFAAWAYWQLKLFGHDDVRILNGGRKFWLDNGLPLTTDVPSYAATGYQLPEPDFSLRAFRDDILPRLGDSRARPRRRPQPGRVQRRDHRPARHERDRPAARPHPGRGLDPVGPDGPRGRHVQGPRRARRPVRGEGRSRPTRTSSPTAGSASARRTRGSSSTSCSATSASATTTAAGPSGAAWSACRSRSRRRRHRVSRGRRSWARGRQAVPRPGARLSEP